MKNFGFEHFMPKEVTGVKHATDLIKSLLALDPAKRISTK
jgi:hypothetical protein